MGFKRRPKTNRAGDKLRRRTHPSATSPSPVRDPSQSTAWERRVENIVVRALRSCDYVHARTADVTAVVGDSLFVRGHLEDHVVYLIQVKRDWHRTVARAGLDVVSGHLVLDVRPLSQTALYVDQVFEATFVAAGRGPQLHSRKGLIAQTSSGSFLVPYATDLDLDDARRKALRKLARDARERAFQANRRIG